ncbi:MAG TPA: Gfo/Idh/MocA family oxidoreductase [Longimicrobiales bacterium]|nr:Gfo/Idh/MocA family oxidoreductase [Longimicrobiales bacterium]
MKNFTLIGAAGYIAPRHMEAIQATGNQLVAAMDPHDAVGKLDSYFPDASFFTEFERFDRHVDKLRRTNDEQAVHYVSICSPNYLHDSHIRFALRSEADAVCEKPLVMNPWNLDALEEIEVDTGRRVYTILQLRLHPAIKDLRSRVGDGGKSGSKHEVDLTYVTARGRWYHHSWKGDLKKSGGVATNIGVHFFDMLHFVFGPLQENRLHYRSDTRAAGYLEYANARVRWLLSVDVVDVPERLRAEGQRTYRSILVDGSEVEFSGGFTDLHTESYRAILSGAGFGIEENRVAIEAVSHIRFSPTQLPGPGEAHPLLHALPATT